MQRVVFAVLALAVWGATTSAIAFMFTQQQAGTVDDEAKAVAQASAQGAAARFEGARHDASDLAELVASNELVLAAESSGAKPVATGKRSKATAAPAAAVFNYEALSARLKTQLGHGAFALFDASGKKLAGDLFGEATQLGNDASVRDVLFGLEHRALIADKDKTSDEVGVPLAGADGRAVGAFFVRVPLAAACNKLGDAQAFINGTALCAGKAVTSQQAGFAPVAAPALPMFFDEGKVGAWTHAITTNGVVIAARTTNHAAVQRLAAAQMNVLMLVGASYVVVLLLGLIAFMLAQKPADQLSDQISLVMQSNGRIDEAQFSGPFKRLAKNVDQLAHKPGVKGLVDAPNVSQLLSTKPEPPPAPEDDELPSAPKIDKPFEKNPAAAVAAPVAPPTPPKFSDFDDDEALSELDRVDAPAPHPVTAPAAETPLGKSRSLSEESLFGIAAHHATTTMPGGNAAAPPPPPPPEDDKPLAGLFSDTDGDDGPDLDGPPSSAPSASSSDAALQMLTGAAPTEPVRAAGQSPWETPAAPSSEDPDEAHFHEVYEDFVRARTDCGEVGDLPYPKFVEKLKKSREQVMQKQACKSVRFQVYVKDGKAALKAVAFR